MKLRLIFAPERGPQESRNTPCNGCPHIKVPVETLLNPPEPNEALKAAATRYNNMVALGALLTDKTARKPIG